MCTWSSTPATWRPPLSAATESIQPLTADAADPELPARIIAAHDPDILAVVAGAKATIRLMAEYADAESQRDGLGIRVRTVLPRLTRETDLGRAAVRIYAERAGVSVEQYAARFGAPVTAAAAGEAFTRLAASDREDDTVAYLLTGENGLIALPAGPGR